VARRPALRQTSFAGGLISPRLFGRTDLERYRQSVQGMRNFIVEPSGVATNRPGLQFLARAKDSQATATLLGSESSKKIEMIPFIFNEDQSYALEFGDQYIRFFTLGGQVVSEVIDGNGINTGTSATVMTDATKAFTVNEFVGGVIRNTTDASEGVITANTATTVTVAALAGGVDNTWVSTDEYEITMQSGDNSSVITDDTLLVDSTKSWTVDEHVGATVLNITDGSRGLCTGNGVNVLSADLAGGAKNLWNPGDIYTIKAPYEISSPYKEEDLPLLKFAQKNDLMEITNVRHHTQELRRLAEDNWTLTALSTTRPVNPPTALVFDPTDPWDAPQTTTPDGRWDWVVTSIDAKGNESLPSDVKSESAANLYPNTTKPLLKWTAPAVGNLPNRYAVYRGHDGYFGFIGETTSTQFQDEARVPDFTDGPPQATDPFTRIITASQAGESRSAAFTGTAESRVAIKTELAQAYDDKYTYHFSFKVICTNDTINDLGGPPVAFPSKVFFDLESRISAGSWIVRASVIFYPHRYPVNTVLSRSAEAFIADADQDHEFRIVQNPASAGQLACTLFEEEKVTWTEATGDVTEPSFPGAVCFFDQRLVLAGFGTEPTTIKASRTGSLANFDVSEPLKDSDAITLELASLRRDQIVNIVPMGAIIVFTTGAEWIVRGSEGSPLSPVSFDLKAKTAYGSSPTVRAATVGDSALFVTNGSRRLRELLVDPYGSQSRSRDLSILADHLTRTETLLGLQYADVPYQLLWLPRSDGLLLGMSYVREHNVFAWHTHDTGGIYTDGSPRDLIESVCVIPENNESRAYVSVRRLLDGVPVRFVEAFATRQLGDSEDAVFLDSSVSFDGRNKRTIDTAIDTSADPGRLNARLEPLEGVHDAGTSATVMTDSGEAWSTDEHVGQTILNLRDGSSGVITSNTDNDITCSAGLTGGTDNDWDLNDEYQIVPSWAAGKKLKLRIVGKAKVGFHEEAGGAPALDSNTLVPATTILDINDEFNGGLLRNLTDLSSTTVTDTIYAAGQISLTGTLAGGIENDWDTNDLFEVEALVTATIFKAADVGTLQVELRVTTLGTVPDASGTLTKVLSKVRCNITKFIDATTVEVTPATAVPTVLQDAYVPDWGLAPNVFSGVSHLAGETISVLVDGATHAQVTVTALGAITLDSGVFAERLHVGIPYVSELVTLPLDAFTQSAELRLSEKAIAAVGVEADEFRGMFVGHKRDQMTEMQERNVSSEFETISPENKMMVERVTGGYARQINVIVQQRDPLPLTVQAIIGTLEIGGNQ